MGLQLFDENAGVAKLAAVTLAQVESSGQAGAEEVADGVDGAGHHHMAHTGVGAGLE
ncbi:uncharacterized protein METZ01_LOCUS195606 [marine metagenome]|uniref:Uncharacterized protein n=1 Tax=marine metagenome TaxID=408172 RepID=A0A382DXC8_9ZZZZ